jgi:hypothetical protein
MKCGTLNYTGNGYAECHYTERHGKHTWINISPNFGLSIIEGITKVLKASSVLNEGHGGAVEWVGVIKNIKNILIDEEGAGKNVL